MVFSLWQEIVSDMIEREDVCCHECGEWRTDDWNWTNRGRPPTHRAWFLGDWTAMHRDCLWWMCDVLAQNWSNNFWCNEVNPEIRSNTSSPFAICSRVYHILTVLVSAHPLWKWHKSCPDLHIFRAEHFQRICQAYVRTQNGEWECNSSGYLGTPASWRMTKRSFFV